MYTVKTKKNDRTTMQKYTKKRQKKHPPLDTLAQLPTTKGQNLLKRARSKWYTERISGGLLHINSPLHKYYQGAYYCNHTLVQENLTIKSKYCNTRVCHICNRIRTAKMMNGYISQLQGRNIQFVTLTLPNVKAEELRYTCDYITKEASNIIRVFRERRKLNINGIRKLEVTYNYQTDTYHPHLHFVVDNYAKELVDEWLLRVKTANRKAQDYRNADQNSLNELFKYTTKIIGHKKGEYIVYTKALDNIMQALQKKRCFQPFGDIRKVSEEVEDNLSVQVYDIQEYSFMEWTWLDCDWVNSKKSTLTGYISPEVDFSYV